MNVKGIILARRDNCHWVRDTYERIIRGIFAGKTIEEGFDMIVDAVIAVIKLEFDITSNLSICRKQWVLITNQHIFLAIFSELMKSLEDQSIQ